MDAFTNIFLSQSTQDEDQPKYKGNVYKKCNQCNKRRKPLDKSHKICRVCYKLNLLTRSSGNQVIDDFIKSTQINGLEADMMEFVPYDRFKDIEYVEKVRAHKATWIDGNVQGWNEEEINFKRSGPKKVVLKRFEDSENITSVDLNRLKNVHDNDLKTEPDIFGLCENHCYGITQDPITKDFVMIMESYMLDDLKHHIANHLISQSGNKVVDDFIRNAQIHSGLKISMMMEFVPYDQFEDVKFIAKVESGGIYKATWIDGNIQGWNNEEIKFERSGLRKVILKKLDDSENITSTELIKLKISLNGNLKTEYGIFGSYVNNCYGITQDSVTKDFMIIMDNYMLDDLKHITDQLLYKSGNKVVDDFIRNTQTGLKVDMMEFVPYDRFKDVEIIAKVDYKATWIDGNIQGWNEEEIDFKRSGLRKVILKKLDDSENITLEELDEKIKIFYNCNSETGHNIFGSYVTNCYGITQDPHTKDFMIIMNNYILDDLKSFIATDHLLHQSGNKVVDEFIKHTQVHSNLEIDMMEFVPYDRFKDVKFVAEGGFSKIYKATWIDGNIQGWNEKEIDFKRTGPRVVALKKLDNSENITSKELNELKIFYDCNLRTKQKQDQPDIGMFVNKWYGITQDHVTKDFMVIMEFYESDLRHYLTNEFYKIDWYIKLVKLVDIVEGLDRIHNAKIIHRDLHSGNILMDIIVLIICDLGLNKSSLVSTDEKEIYGVIPYVAPEIFQGKEYTMASDMYSFGMIMWEFMTYRRPFWDRIHDTELIIGICDGLRPSIVTNAPEGYTKIMQECWDPDPDKRPKPADINKRLYEIINVERKNPTKIAKSPDIGPITTKNPGAIYTSRLLSEMIKSAMTTRSLKSQSIISGSDKRNFEDELTEVNQSIKRNRLSENEINSKTEGNS